jgi:hypothetical protein
VGKVTVRHIGEGAAKGSLENDDIEIEEIMFLAQERLNKEKDAARARAGRSDVACKRTGQEKKTVLSDSEAHHSDFLRL